MLCYAVILLMESIKGPKLYFWYMCHYGGVGPPQKKKSYQTPRLYLFDWFTGPLNVNVKWHLGFWQVFCKVLWEHLASSVAIFNFSLKELALYPCVFIKFTTWWRHLDILLHTEFHSPKGLMQLRHPFALWLLSLSLTKGKGCLS